MVTRRVIVALVLISVCQVSQQNPLEPFFRKDYEYNGRQEAFYKVHSIPVSWSQAYVTCALESAQLVYPTTSDEADLLVKLSNGCLTKDIAGIWVGAHDKFSEGIYQNLEGKDLSSMFSKWAKGEPNDADKKEDCMAFTRTGELNDNNCDYRLPFICKKLLSTIKMNTACETTDPGYVPSDDKDKCYKLHTHPRNWHDAFAACHAEGSYLTIINNMKEANYISNLVKKIPDNTVKGSYNRHFIGIGFHDLYHEGDYVTIHGKSLDEAGFNEWENNQPDNYNNNENCGSLTLNGRLNDINCDVRMVFVCERDLGDPNVVDLFSRYDKA